MNMKKQLMMGMTFIAVLSSSGCGVIKLTEEQNAQAAEYIAGVMLKHTVGYDKSLIYPVVTTEPVSLGEEEVDTPTTGGESNTSTQKKPSSNKPSKGEQESLTELNDIYGIKGCKIQYKNVKVCSEYMDSPSYGVFAEKGKKLVVVKFQMKNTSARRLKVNLHKKDITYQLVLPDGKTVSSQVTMLGNDMNYLSANLKKDGKTEGIVMFMIDKKINTKKLTMKVVSEKAIAEVKL